MQHIATNPSVEFKPGDLVRARGREWVVLPELRENLLKLRPLGGAEQDATLIYLPLEPKPPVPATFDLPNPDLPGSQEAALLLRDALRLKLRAGAGPFRSFGNLNVEPRPYQLAPLLMALKLDPVRLLIADDVGIGKTIEAGLIVRELFDRGEIDQFTVICPPHLCEQWQRELAEKFNFNAEVVRTGTATRLERGLRPDESVFEAYPFTVVSLDYIKSDSRRDDFRRTCPDFIIVDEAHTCARGNTNTRHLRYQLLKMLATSEPLRGLLLLTATPHSGDDTAFHNLLGLLNPEFSELANMPKGDKRQALRNDLALHFVQRRRTDIVEWEDKASFPTRENKETTYHLTGDWGTLFGEVLAYARTMVRRAEGGTKLQQRMSWWAALALLRCVSSSPAAASMALRTRLRVADGESEQIQIENLDLASRETVMDEAEEESLLLTENVPAGTIEEVNDSVALRQLIARTNELRGKKNDPKLKTLIREVRSLVRAGFKPIVFCRYIATAHYAGDELKKALPPKRTYVVVITGELTSDQREERVEELGKLPEEMGIVLVATDCLSEGVNLQSYFNAVVHYDLTWNPTRHEQREGRVDRFGQASKTVRALMLYGANNPVDGAVLRVILRKAKKIREELGVSVPSPTDNNKLIDAIMKSVLLHGSSYDQMVLDFGDTETNVDDAWQAAKKKISRTVFAQRRLKPKEVLPEWQKAVSALGSPGDVARFVRLSAERLGAPLDTQNGCFRLPVRHLPKPLQERLGEIGFTKSTRIVFEQPQPTGSVHIHRAHPIVSTLADYVAEQALDGNGAEIGARCGAMFSRNIETRTVLYLLRLRSQLHVELRGPDGRYSPLRSLLAEECLGIAIQGSGAPELMTNRDALSLLSMEPRRNMPNGQKTYLVKQALDALSDVEDIFNRIAHEKANLLLADHRRIREASNTKGLRYNVVPSLPMDVIGIYLFLPVTSLS